MHPIDREDSDVLDALETSLRSLRREAWWRTTVMATPAPGGYVEPLGKACGRTPLGECRGGLCQCEGGDESVLHSARTRGCLIRKGCLIKSKEGE